MVVEGFTIPLWGKLILFSLGKKVAIVTAGYLYGFPRLYRKSQKAVRFVTRDVSTQKQLSRHVQTAFRLPGRLLHLERSVPLSPALRYSRQLPSRLLPAYKTPVRPSASPLAPKPMSRKLSSSFASSHLLSRPTQSWAASRARLVSLRKRFSNSQYLQSMMEARAQRIFELWEKCKKQPYALVPAA